MPGLASDARWMSELDLELMLNFVSRPPRGRVIWVKMWRCQIEQRSDGELLQVCSCRLEDQQCKSSLN